MNLAWVIQHAGVLVCAAVAVVCICRLDLMNYREHKLRWVLGYFLMAAIAAWSAADLLQYGQLDLLRAAIVAAELCYLLSTTRRWRAGLPPCVRKPRRPHGHERSHS